MAEDRSRNPSGANRPKHRDNDDVRDPLAPDERAGTKPDTRTEARGDARENAGNVARGTAAHPTGPEANDNTAGRPRRDRYDETLETDSRKSRE